MKNPKTKKTNHSNDLNDYIKESHIKAVEEFNEELRSWDKETSEKEPTLYENPNTSFTLSELYIENGYLKYRYGGREDEEEIIHLDDVTNQYYEDGTDGIMEYIKFLRNCLKHAKKYWNMEAEKLDKLQDGDGEDNEDNEEE